MTKNQDIDKFLSAYDEEVIGHALEVRALIFKTLPQIQEQIDLPAKMIAYSYGQKYSEMICTLIPSQKGLKLGFYKGVDLSDPENLLEGKGKISRYVEIKASHLKSKALEALLKEALLLYNLRKK